jgi:hypothetical protein
MIPEGNPTLQPTAMAGMSSIADVCEICTSSMLMLSGWPCRDSFASRGAMCGEQHCDSAGYVFVADFVLPRNLQRQLAEDRIAHIGLQYIQ